jgi:hypothetical protein
MEITDPEDVTGISPHDVPRGAMTAYSKLIFEPSAKFVTMRRLRRSLGGPRRCRAAAVSDRDP